MRITWRPGPSLSERGLHDHALASGDDQAAALLAGIVGAARLHRGDLRQAQNCLIEFESAGGLGPADVRGMLPHILRLLAQTLALAGTREALARRTIGAKSCSPRGSIRLVLSTRTVESHLYHAMGKLEVESRLELVRFVGCRETDAIASAPGRLRTSFV